MNDERLDYLLERYLDGAIGELELAELERRLLAEPQARAHFWRVARVHAALREWGSREWGRQLGHASAIGDGLPCPVPLPAGREVVRVDRRRQMAAIFLMAAMLAVFCAVFFFERNEAARRAKDDSAELEQLTELPKDRTIAVMTRTMDARGEGELQNAGTALTPGWLRIESGTVQVDFASGAQLVIAGPAEVELVSEVEAFVQAGKVTAVMTRAARSFILRSRTIRVAKADGTVGLLASREGPEELHVLHGRVQATAVDEEAETLAGGAAVAAWSDGFMPVSLDRELFITPEQLAQWDLAERQLRFASWKKTAEKWSRDADTLVHYTFQGQEPWETSLLNRAVRAAHGTDGAIVGARWSEGRWSGKRALEFRSTGDRVRFTVPGKHKATTCIMWVFVEELPSGLYSLLHSEAQEPGEFRWSLNRDGAQGAAVRATMTPKGPSFYRVTTVSQPKSEVVGRWVCLGVTYDSERKILAHYRNGELLYPGHVGRGAAPAIYGIVELGNWGVDPTKTEWQWAAREGPKFYVRNLRGWIDEVLILSRALTDAEMRQFYEDGRPTAPGLARR